MRILQVVNDMHRKRITSIYLRVFCLWQNRIFFTGSREKFPMYQRHYLEVLQIVNV